jgi:hypothetical protein
VGAFRGGIASVKRRPVQRRPLGGRRRRSRSALREQPTGNVNAIAKTFAYELEDVLDELEREYLKGVISREEWSDRRSAHLAWFAERGIEGPHDEPVVDSSDATQRPHSS